MSLRIQALFTHTCTHTYTYFSDWPNISIFTIKLFYHTFLYFQTVTMKLNSVLKSKKSIILIISSVICTMKFVIRVRMFIFIQNGSEWYLLRVICLFPQDLSLHFRDTCALFTSAGVGSSILGFLFLWRLRHLWCQPVHIYGETINYWPNQGTFKSKKECWY